MTNSDLIALRDLLRDMSPEEALEVENDAVKAASSELAMGAQSSASVRLLIQKGICTFEEFDAADKQARVLMEKVIRSCFISDEAGNTANEKFLQWVATGKD